MFGALIFPSLAQGLSRGPFFIDLVFGSGIAELYLLPFIASVYIWYMMFGLFVLYLFFAIYNTESYVSIFTIILISYFGWKHYNNLTFDSIKQFGTSLAIYFICAVVWMILKMKMHSKSKKYTDFVEVQYKKNNDIETLQIARDYFNCNYNIFINWFFYWSISILNTLLVDILSELIDAVFNYFRHMFLDIFRSRADNILSVSRSSANGDVNPTTRFSIRRRCSQ